MTALPLGGGIAMGEAARRKVQNQFNEDFVVKAYLAVLAGLEAAKPGIRC